MKNLLLVISLIPVLAFSQVSNWRNNPPQQKVSSPSRSSIPQRNGISSWRNESPKEFNRPNRTRSGSNIIVRDRWDWNYQGWGWNRWGWYQPFPYIWYDDFGWRQRSVIRVYEDGRRDTIVKPRYFTAGLGHTSNNQASFWGAVGDKGYFILDYVMSYDIDRNAYYPNGNLAIADFPISNELFRKEQTIYLGGGKRFGKLGIHGMVGFGNEILRYQGRDAMGGISFPKSNINFATIKFGILRDFKFFTLKIDRDPIRNFTQFSIGLNNR